MSRRPPPAHPAEFAEPADLAALFEASDGVEIDDGTRLLARAEIGPATAWLVEEKALAWPSDLIVIGERDDLVVIRDLDVAGARAGGGVLEAPTDGLEAPRRVALDVIEYLELRLGRAPTGPVAPERASRDAVDRRDADALGEVLGRPFYPGAERDLARAAATLGELAAAAGDLPRAMAAFARAADARGRLVPTSARGADARVAWSAFAAAADAAGARDVAEACRARGASLGDAP